MRLWSLHPSYLDTQGLLALWREALLAQAVLRGRTKGYKHHPQLVRFRRHPLPRKAIAAYLWHVFLEASKRGHSFNAKKVRAPKRVTPMAVTTGQVEHEFRHLLGKLKARAPERFEALRSRKRFRTHPLFRTRPGAIELWERV